MPIQDESRAIRFLYVLELEGGRYYIGHTTTEKRISSHFSGKGAAWTKLHKPLAIKERIDLGEITFNEAEEAENNYTIQYMRLYGWRNVRGGFFSLTDEHGTKQSLLSHKRRGTLLIDFHID